MRRMRGDGLDSATVVAEMRKAAVHAIEEKANGALKALVEEGLDVNQKAYITMNRRTYEQLLFHKACSVANQEAAAFLIESGCDPLVHDVAGQLPHHLLAGMGFFPC